MFWGLWGPAGDDASLLVLAGLAVLSALLSLDDTSLAQTWLSQPLPAGILAGVLCGDPGAGLALGLPFQLLTVGNLPMGQTLGGEQVSAMVAGVGSVVLTGRHLTSLLQGAGSTQGGLLGWILLGAVFCSLAGRWALAFERRAHFLWMLEGYRSLRDGTMGRFERIHVRCLMATAFRGVVLFAVWLTLLAGVWLPLYDQLPVRLMLACSYLPLLVPALAVGILIDRYGLRNCWPFRAGGFVVALGLVLVF